MPDKFHCKDFHQLLEFGWPIGAAIAKSSGGVVVEDLNVAGMMRNRRLARAIADAAMAGFLAQLAYKCLWYGAEYVRADRWFPSSRLRAHCGWCKGNLELVNRQWYCDDCGALNERDLNAAANLSHWPGLRLPVSGRGDRLSRQWPVKRQGDLPLLLVGR